MVASFFNVNLQGPDARSRAASEVGNSQAHESEELSFLKETVQDLKVLISILFVFRFITLFSLLYN